MSAISLVPQPPPSSVPPCRGCFLTSLPNVLIHLLAHFLQCREILLFSRCSVRLQALAHASFCWKAAPPLHVQLGRANSPVPQAPFPLSEFMHVRVCLPHLNRFSDFTCDSLVAVSEMTRVSGLVLAGASEALATQTLSLPSLQALTFVRLRVASTSVLAIVCALPSLRSLTITGCDGHCDFSPLLHASSSLTELDVSENAPSAVVDGADLGVPLLGHCALLSLTIRLPKLIGDRWRAFFSGHNMPLLQQLQYSMEWYGDQHLPPPEEIAAGFAMMQQLRVLKLIAVRAVESLLEHVHACPSLTQLHVSVDHSCGPLLPASLASVLLRCSRLLVLIHITKATDPAGLASEMSSHRLIKSIHREHPAVAHRLLRIVDSPQEDGFCAPQPPFPDEWTPALGMKKIERAQWCWWD